MKRISILFCLIIVLSFSSCTTYYYSKLSPADLYTQENENGELFFENDTVLVAYNFYGENAPITISIYNKSSKPLFVDWSKSALIIDDVVTSYKESNMNISAFANSSGYSYGRYGDWVSSQGEVKGVISIPNDAEFIPPKSKVIQTPLELAGFSFDKYKKNEYQRRKFYAKDQLNNILIKDFTEQDTPLFFRSFLTLFDSTKPSEPIYLEQEFYVSQLIKAGGISPKDFAAKPNMFYVVKETGKNAGNITAAIVLGVAGVALEVAAERNNQ